MSIQQPPDPEDPIEYFIDHLAEVGREPETIVSYRTALNSLKEFLSQRGIDPGDVTQQDCVELLALLKDELKISTVSTRASCINGFYQFFSDRGTFETNPMAVALEEVDIQYKVDNHRREITLGEMREFIQSLGSPHFLTITVLLAKTGIRSSELANLDLRDVHIDHPRSDRVLPAPRAELIGKPDSLFIDSNIGAEDIVNGDRRVGGNKRQRSTIIPLDDETKQTLLYWLAARPPSLANGPPLIMTKRTGQRATRWSIGGEIRREAASYGWHSKGGGVQNNVTTHYFRHWFTTMARSQGMPRPVIKYIRGDTDEDMVDHYTHNWGDETRDSYLDNIYKLFPS
jgi:integrase